MIKKLALILSFSVTQSLFSMFAILPGAAQPAAATAARPLAAISEHAVLAPTSDAHAKKAGEKKEKELKRIKALKPFATRIVVRKTSMKTGPVIELYAESGFKRAIPFQQFEGVSIAGLLKKEAFSFKQLSKQCASWVDITDKTIIEDKTK